MEKIKILLQILNEINNLIKEKEISLYKIIEILHSKIEENTENDTFIKENCHLKSEIIEKSKLNNILQNENKLLNQKYEYIKSENDEITSKILDKSKNLIETENNTLKKQKKSQNKITNPTKKA